MENPRPTEPKYWSFISYAHADEAWAAWLHRKLESYAVPTNLVGRITSAGSLPRHIYPVFRDRDELPGTSDLNEDLEKALRNTRSLIVICTPRSARSRWVEQEIRYFKARGLQDRVFYLIAEGVPHASDIPGQENLECLSPSAYMEVDADGNLTSVRREPLCADARPEGDGRRNAFLKLVAGILGVGYDEVRRRDQERRERRLKFMAAGASVLLVIFCALATFGFLQAERANLEARRASIEAGRANLEAQRANLELRKAEEWNRFVTDMLQSVDPQIAQGADTTLLRRILENGARRMGTLNEPETQARLHGTIGKVYQSVGLYEESRLHLAAARELFLQSLGPLHSSTLTAMSDLGALHLARGEFDEAQVLFEEALINRLRISPPEDPSTLALKNNLAGLYQTQGRVEDAEHLYLELLTARRQQLGAGHPDTLSTQNNLALLYAIDGRPAEARPLFEDTLKARTDLLGEDHPLTLNSQNNLALVYEKLGRTDAAEQLHLKTLASRRRILGEEHPDTLRAASNLANHYRETGQLEKAEHLFLETLKTRDRTLGADHPDTLTSRINLADLKERQGDFEAAAAQYRLAREGSLKTLGPEHPDTLNCTHDLARLLLTRHQFVEARALCQTLFDVRTRLDGAHAPSTLQSGLLLALACQGDDDLDTALQLARQLLSKADASLGPEHAISAALRQLVSGQP